MITGLYAALLGLVFLGLTYHVIAGRYTYKIGLGDGGNETLLRRIRIHGNFTETAPLALVLMILSELEGMPIPSLHAVGIMLVAGRISHAIGLTRSSRSSLGRMVGMVLTHIAIASCCIFLIWKYLSR